MGMQSSTGQIYPRRKYFVIGSAVYYRGLLIGSHAMRQDQRLLSALEAALILQNNETFCHDCHPLHRHRVEAQPLSYFQKLRFAIALRVFKILMKSFDGVFFSHILSIRSLNYQG